MVWTRLSQSCPPLSVFDDAVSFWIICRRTLMALPAGRKGNRVVVAVCSQVHHKLELFKTSGVASIYLGEGSWRLLVSWITFHQS